MKPNWNEMTAKNFKPSEDMLSAAAAVFTTMAYVRTVRPIVEEYQKKILEAYELWSTETERRSRKRITDPKETFLLSEDDFNFYLAECHEAQLEAELKTESPDPCAHFALALFC